MSPSPSQLAALLVAAAAAADVVEAHPTSDSRTTAMELIAAAAEHAAVCDARRLDRRLGVYAASWAATYLRRFADRRTATVLRGVAAMDLPRTVAASQRALYADAPGTVGGTHPLDLRLLQRTPAGIVIDQLTHAHTTHAVGVDTYARAAIAAHMALGAQFESFAGVRLLAPRVPLASVHLPPTGDAHPLGACPVCPPAGDVR